MRFAAIALIAATAAAAPIADASYYSKEELLALDALIKLNADVSARDADYAPSYGSGSSSKGSLLDLSLGAKVGLGLKAGLTVDAVLKLDADVLAKVGLTLKALLDLDAKIKATLDIGLDALLKIQADLIAKAVVDIDALLKLNAKIAIKLGLDLDALIKLNLSLLVKLGLDLDALLDLDLAAKVKADVDISLGAGQSVPYGYKYSKGLLIDVNASIHLKLALLHIINICLDVNAKVDLSLGGEALKIKAFLLANLDVNALLKLQASLKADLDLFLKAALTSKNSALDLDVLAKLGLKVSARDYYGYDSEGNLLDLDALVKLAAKVNVRDAAPSYYGSSSGSLIDADVKALIDADVNL